MHSKALKHIKNYTVKSKGGPETELPIIIGIDLMQIDMGFKSYIADNNLEDYQYLGSITPGYNFDSINRVSLSANNQQYSKDFYTLAISISNIQGNSATEIESQLTSIENSAKFQNLSNIEKTMLIASSEVFLDSYNYWNNELQGSSGSQAVMTKGFFSGFFKVIKSDFHGAIGGALSGAAVIGGTTGAVIGAAVGAMSSSAIAALAIQKPTLLIRIPEESTFVHGIVIPKEWDEILIP